MAIQTHPARAYHDHQHIDCGEALAKAVSEIDAGRNAVDVAEDGVAAIAMCEPVENSTGDVHGIVSPIRDRDLGHARPAGDWQRRVNNTPQNWRGPGGVATG